MKEAFVALVVACVSRGAAPVGDNIGLQLEVLDKEVARATKCPVRVGVVVTGVKTGGPGFLASMKDGDVISRIDDALMPTLDAINEWSASTVVGKKYHFTVYRHNGKKWLKLTPIVKVTQKKAETVDDDESANIKTAASTGRLLVGDGHLGVSLWSDVVYLPARGEKSLHTFLTHVYFQRNGGVQYDKEGFYSIDGKPEKINWTSENPAVVEVGHHDVLGTVMTAKESGTTNIVVTLAGKASKLPLRVMRLGIEEGDESEAVVKVLGLPDEEQRHFVKWPKEGHFDGIIYSPDENNPIVSAKHWRFNKYPNLVVSIVNGKVHSVETNRKEMNPN